MNSEAKNPIKYNPDPNLLEQLRTGCVLIKYGGNAMINSQMRESVFDQIYTLTDYGIIPVIVHGGGPVIKELLQTANIESEFIGGHRKTDRNAMKYVEMALSGHVNGDIVKGLNRKGLRAVGLSGKDGSMVRTVKRYHRSQIDGKVLLTDLGFVGDVESVDTSLILMLLENGYLPVIAPIGVGDDGEDYNINADMFAGNVAGALKAEAFVAMTDVDGLLENPADPGSLISKINGTTIKTKLGNSIAGGMIPKVEACLIALEKGAKAAHIINGMKPNTLLNQLLSNRKGGTTIEI
jgi:acetylglutamate kinase